MDIQTHPIWKSISPYKKWGHLLRFSLAKRFARLYPSSTFIGITGSVGKTTTAKAAYQVLSQKIRTISTAENLDPILNIPITLLRLRPSIKKAILEMGIEYPGEMDFYLSLVRPATAIVTKVYFAHSEFLGGIEEIVAQKQKLVKQLPKSGYAILNWDDPYARKMADATGAQVVFFGTDEKKCNVWAGNARIEAYQVKFELNYGVERVEVNFKLLGKHQIYPALAAAALGISCGIPLMSIKKGLEAVLPAPHRMQVLEGLNGTVVLDDTYNSSPAALEEALNVLQQVPARRRIAVLGEMRELGGFSQKLHALIAQKIYKDKVDLVVLGGGDARFIAEELERLGFSSERCMADLSNSQMVSRLLGIAGKGDVILVKGSRAVRLDEVVKRICKKKEGT